MLAVPFTIRGFSCNLLFRPGKVIYPCVSSGLKPAKAGLGYCSCFSTDYEPVMRVSVPLFITLFGHSIISVCPGIYENIHPIKSNDRRKEIIVGMRGKAVSSPSEFTGTSENKICTESGSEMLCFFEITILLLRSKDIFA